MYNKRAFHRHMSNHHRPDNTSSCVGGGRRHAWKKPNGSSFKQPPVNVKELDDKYELHLFAPGFEKKDFLIALLDQTLSISVNEKERVQETWKRKEYLPAAFVREFELNDKIDKTAIDAKYKNGVLILTLPKLEGFESTRQEIKIS